MIARVSGPMRELSLHFWKFNAVGLIGIGVQLVVLAALNYGLRMNYLVATLIAVEVAVLHNFAWHQKWTWVDRVAVSAREIALRLLWFHVTNGILSIVGNLILMRAFVGEAHMGVLPANIITIAICWIANFLLSDRFVFRTREP